MKVCDSQIAAIDLHHNWVMAVQDVERADGCQSTCYNYSRTLCIKCWVSAFHTHVQRNFITLLSSLKVRIEGARRPEERMTLRKTLLCHGNCLFSVGKNSSFISENSLIWVGDTISGQCGNLVALFLWLYRINKVIYSNSFTWIPKNIRLWVRLFLAYIPKYE